MPIHKVLLWSGFGIAVRLWQLGIEMRPLFNRQSLWVYPIYASVGGSFGYWLSGVEQRQVAFLQQKRAALLEKRQRRAQRDGLDPALGEQGADAPGRTGVGLMPQEGGAQGGGVAPLGQ